MALWLGYCALDRERVRELTRECMYSIRVCSEDPPAEPVRHSIVFVSNFFNLTMFNIGFHLEHHENPGSIGQNYRNFHQTASRRSSFTGERHVVPFGNYHAAFYSRGDEDRENDPTEQDPRYTSNDHCTVLLILS